MSALAACHAARLAQERHDRRVDVQLSIYTLNEREQLKEARLCAEDPGEYAPLRNPGRSRSLSVPAGSLDGREACAGYSRSSSEPLTKRRAEKGRGTDGEEASNAHNPTATRPRTLPHGGAPHPPLAGRAATPEDA